MRSQRKGRARIPTKRAKNKKSDEGGVEDDEEVEESSESEGHGPSTTTTASNFEPDCSGHNTHSGYSVF